MRCEICEADANGCERGLECPDMRRSALEAGIPASVIDGHRHLGEVYSADAIEWMANNEWKDEKSW